MVTFTINTSISENQVHKRFLNGGSQGFDGPRVAAMISAEELVMKASRRLFPVVLTRYAVTVSANE
jgi:hypothetical protein